MNPSALHNAADTRLFSARWAAAAVVAVVLLVLYVMTVQDSVRRGEALRQQQRPTVDVTRSSAPGAAQRSQAPIVERQPQPIRT